MGAIAAIGGRFFFCFAFRVNGHWCRSPHCLQLFRVLHLAIFSAMLRLSGRRMAGDSIPLTGVSAHADARRFVAWPSSATRSRAAFHQLSMGEANMRRCLRRRPIVCRDTRWLARTAVPDPKGPIALHGNSLNALGHHAGDRGPSDLARWRCFLVSCSE